MKTFNNNGTSGLDLTHLRGNKDDYTITESAGSLIYESVSLDRKYILTDTEYINFKHSNGVSNRFSWSNEFSTFKNTQLLNGLLSYWPLDGNLTDIIGGRDMTSYGIGGFEDIKFGSGYYLHDGGFIQVATNDFHTDEFAVSMWVEYLGQFDTDNTTPIIINYESDFELAVTDGTGSYMYAIWGNTSGSWNWFDTSSSNYNNSLIHLVYQYNRELGRMEIWVNGTNIFNDSFSREIGVDDTALTIGGRSAVAGEASSKSNLKVSDIGVYNKYLNQSDIDLIISNAEAGKRLIY